MSSDTLNKSCKQVAPLIPQDGYKSHEQFYDEKFRSDALNVWSGAVKIPTITYDDMGIVGVDPRWDIFQEFHAYLEKTFPEVFKTAQVETVNTYGLLLTFAGSDCNLKPAVFMAHQDVVPVPEQTLHEWEYPPFECHFDGEFLWGRGSTDNKNNLIGILQAFDSLVKQGFHPKRTFIISLGFSEEIEGDFSAYRISHFLRDRYGPKGLALILDEGLGFQDMFGTIVCGPCLGEKGYVDIRIKVNSHGGHSAIPPDHTGIGILSEVITELETNKYELQLTPKNPLYAALHTIANANVSTMDPKISNAIKRMDSDKEAKNDIISHIEKAGIQQYYIRTSQAVDVIQGGSKINSLPEEAEVGINHRIVPGETVADIENHVLQIVRKVAKRHNFAVKRFDNNIEDCQGDPSKGLFTLTSKGHDPAPVTRSDGVSWDVLSGTIKYNYRSLNPLVVPSIMVASTDSKYFWDCTDIIYRYAPCPPAYDANMHTINERCTLDGHIEGIGFYYNYIRNIDKYGEKI